MIFLDPADLRLERKENQPPSLIVSGDRYLNVHIRQAFPLTAEQVYISFFDQDDRYIGMIQETEALDPDSRQIIETEIGWRYFMPKILRINEMQERGGKARFVTETDQGPVNISMKDLRGSMVELSLNRILLTDEYNNRYEIPDVSQLDRHSQRLIRRLI